jgi:hypothetical protein
MAGVDMGSALPRVRLGRFVRATGQETLGFEGETHVVLRNTLDGIDCPRVSAAGEAAGPSPKPVFHKPMART